MMDKIIAASIMALVFAGCSIDNTTNNNCIDSNSSSSTAAYVEDGTQEYPYIIDTNGDFPTNDGWTYYNIVSNDNCTYTIVTPVEVSHLYGETNESVVNIYMSGLPGVYYDGNPAMFTIPDGNMTLELYSTDDVNISVFSNCYVEPES
jgi:hypothetical protein